MNVISNHNVAFLPRLDQGVGFEYCGRMKGHTVETLLKWTETLVKAQPWSVSKRKRFLRCMIELTQNLSKHGHEGRFCCHVATNGLASLMSSNVVNAAQKQHLEEALTKAQSTAFVDLKAEKLDKLVHGQRTQGGGAGLGLMDMRACSNDNLRSEFLPCDEGSFIFELTIAFPS